MNIFFAPIQGITTAPYRKIYSDIFGGVDKYYAPFITTTPKRSMSKSLFKDIMPEHNNPDLMLIPQLLSNNGEEFREYAKFITDLGYTEIDWNIGCPYPTVTKKVRGSGILPHPEMIRSVLDEVSKDAHYNLSVKMRLGLNSIDEGKAVIDVLNDYPLSKVTIHGRTGSQRYEGTVDLKAFSKLLNQCEHQITYNGDIFTYDDFCAVKKQFPEIENFMLARGILRDPLLPQRIRGHQFTPAETLSKIIEFHHAIFHHFRDNTPNEQKLCGIMKEFWLYTSTTINPDKLFFDKIKICQNTTDYLSIIDEMFKTYDKYHCR